MITAVPLKAAVRADYLAMLLMHFSIANLA